MFFTFLWCFQLSRNLIHHKFISVQDDLLLLYVWSKDEYGQLNTISCWVDHTQIYISSGFLYDCLMLRWDLHNIDGLMRERHNSIAGAPELRLSCTNPSIYIAACTVYTGKILFNSCSHTHNRSNTLKCYQSYRGDYQWQFVVSRKCQDVPETIMCLHVCSTFVSNKIEQYSWKSSESDTSDISDGEAQMSDERFHKFE